MGELARTLAALRVRHAFLVTSITGGLDPIPRRVFWGLGWLRHGGHLRRPYPRAPWGWRWLKEPDRNAAVCLPLWLYWPLYLWHHWPSIVFERLERVGLWRVHYEGDFWVDGFCPLVWCFLHDTDAAPRTSSSRRLSFIRSRKLPPSMRIYGDPALLRRLFP